MRTRARWAGVTALALLLGLLALPAAPAGAQVGADVSIIKDNEAPSNTEIATRLSEETDPPGSVQRVLISRDDAFADALASGVLQADAPLLLVPTGGPVPDRVMTEIQRLGAREVVILGGTAAVAPAVDSQLAATGLAVQRRQGGSRIETAIDIAQAEAPDATTAILARAFETNPDDPTQAFADALGAGGLAAENRWPVLLSQTGELTAATRAYLAQSDIRELKLVGGTAALSSAVEAEIEAMGITTERIAGDSRGGTALEIAKELGAQTAADISHVILADATGPDAWAGGFAAARRSAVLDAPILLADGVRLLPESTEFLTPGATFAQAGELTVTCVVHPLACTDGRRALGLIDYPILSADPPRGVLVAPGQAVTLTLSPTSEGVDVPVLTDGSCVAEPIEQVTDGAGQVRVTFAAELPPPICILNVTYGSTDGSGFNRASLAYSTEEPAGRTADQAFVASQVVAFGSVVPDQPVIVNDTITCTSPGGQPTTRDAWAMQAQDQQPGLAAFDAVAVGSEPLLTTADAACTITITAPPQATRVFWGLYSFSDVGLRVPLALGNGTTATFDLAQVAAESGVDTRDVSVGWVVQIDDPMPTAPQPQPPGPHGVINNPDGLPIICDGVRMPQGLGQAAVGARCTVQSPSTDFHVLVIQPDRPNVSALQAEFSPLAESRFTTVRAQLLASAGGGGGEGPESSCETARPVEIGRASGGAILEPEVPTFHRFDGRAGQELRLRLSEFAMSDLDPVLTLIGPDGQEVATNDDAEGSLNSRIDVVLPADGTYCIEAAGYASSIGDYLLAVDPAPYFVEEWFIDETNPDELYDLTAQAGERTVLEMRTTSDSELTDPVLVILDAQGTIVAEDDDGGGHPNARIEFDVPADGVYTVVATVFDETTYGAYTLEVSDVLPGPGFASVTHHR